MGTVGSRSRSGIYLESTSDEEYGVLPGEDRLVQDVMSRLVVTVDAKTSLKEAVDTLRQRNVSALVVCRDGEPAGTLTEHDLAVTGTPSANSPGSTTVHEFVVKQDVVTCRDNAILGDALRAMADHRIHALPVVNAEGRLVGLLSLMDAVGALMPHAAEVWLAKMREPGA
jgi:CBS domain-containing protein